MYIYNLKETRKYNLLREGKRRSAVKKNEKDKGGLGIRRNGKLVKKSRKLAKV